MLSLGNGLTSRCWGAFTTGIFLTCVADMGLWVSIHGYIPWPLSATTWYIRFLAAAAFAAAPAYQVGAIRPAHRATLPSGRFWSFGSA